MKLSVIIPVYNTAQYLKACLDSVINQTFKDIEIIIVNDGSTDNSQNIIDEYALKYPNIKVIKQENKGYSLARNPALEIATGEYIGFVDSDDTVTPYMYEKMISCAEEQGADIVSCSFYHVYFEKDTHYLLDSNELYVNLLKQNRSKDNKHSLKDYGELLLDHGFVWDRIYRTSMLRENNIKFPTDIKFGEDTYFHRIALCAAKNIVYIPDPLYYYRRGRIGAQTMLKDKRNMSYLLNCQKLYGVAKEHHLESLYPWFNHLTLSLCSFGCEQIDEEFKDEYYNKFTELIKTIPEPFKVAYPDYTDTGLLIKARYMVLRLLHPLLYLSLKHNNRTLFMFVIKLRRFLQDAPNIIRKLIKKGD